MQCPAVKRRFGAIKKPEQIAVLNSWEKDSSAQILKTSFRVEGFEIKIFPPTLSRRLTLSIMAAVDFAQFLMVRLG